MTPVGRAAYQMKACPLTLMVLAASLTGGAAFSCPAAALCEIRRPTRKGAVQGHEAERETRDDRQPRGGRVATRGSPLWTPGMNRSR